MAIAVEPEFLKQCVYNPTGHRAFVGPPEKFDLIAASQFHLLSLLGLREDHTLLDIGCGALRGGRLFMTYLLPDHYYGIEPEQWLLDAGIEHEIGRDMLQLKRPTFNRDREFTLTAFQREFDYLLAQSIFSHAAPSQLRRCLSQAKLVLAPEGVFAATYIPGATSYDGDSWVYPGPVEYTFDDIHRVAQSVDLACISLDWPHPNGQRWVAFYHPTRRPPQIDFPTSSPKTVVASVRCPASPTEGKNRSIASLSRSTRAWLKQVLSLPNRSPR